LYFVSIAGKLMPGSPERSIKGEDFEILLSIEILRRLEGLSALYLIETQSKK
jgi:hypothetical protein